jgi:apolipoprotein N-acyltransferase
VTIFRHSGGPLRRILRFCLVLGLLLTATWHPAERLFSTGFAVLALGALDRRGFILAAAVIFVTLLYHFEPAAIWLGMFGYTLFFSSIAGLRTKRAALIGFGFGAGVTALNLRWLVAEFDTNWAGLVLLMVVLYGGLFMAGVGALLRLPTIRRPGFLGLCLTVLTLPACDYLRMILPRFGTVDLYSGLLPIANIDLAQAARWAGAGGMSALMAFGSYAAATWWLHERKSRWAPRIAARQVGRLQLGIAGLLVIGLMSAGELQRHRRLPNADRLSLRAGLIQSGQSPPESDPTARRYQDSLGACLEDGSHFDILFLPEGAISIAEWNDPNEPEGEHLMSLSELKSVFGSQINSPVITGAMIRKRVAQTWTFRNTALSLDTRLEPIGTVDKQFGAPLVEVNPFDGIPGLAMIGEKATHLSRRMIPEKNGPELPITSGLRATVAICNEHQLPDIWVRRGVPNLQSDNLQLVLSDLTWFDHSEEERSQSRLARRLIAVKYRRPLLYVASGGSEFWTSDGALVHALETDTPFAFWDLSFPSLETCARNAWTPLDESWPLCLFLALFVSRLFLSRQKRVSAENRRSGTRTL